MQGALLKLFPQYKSTAFQLFKQDFMYRNIEKFGQMLAKLVPQ